MPKAFSLEFRRDVVAVARKGEAPSGQQRVTRRFAAGPVRCGVGAGQRCRFAGVLVELACQAGGPRVGQLGLISAKSGPHH